MALVNYGKVSNVCPSKTLFVVSRVKMARTSGELATGDRAFNESVLSFDSRDSLLAAMERCHAQDIFPGVDLQRFYRNGSSLVCTTEQHSEDIGPFPC